MSRFKLDVELNLKLANDIGEYFDMEAKNKNAIATPEYLLRLPWTDRFSPNILPTASQSDSPTSPSSTREKLFPMALFYWCSLGNFPASYF